MANFSLEQLRKITSGETGYSLDLTARYDEAKAVGGLATSASSFLNTAVACILIDRPEPARQLLQKSRQWLEAAIDGNERPRRYFSHATEAQRLYDLAMCRWLCDASNSVELLQESNAAWERWYDSERKIDRTSFVMTVYQYVDANAQAQLNRRILQLWPSATKRPLEIAVALKLLLENPDRSMVEELYKQRVAEWLRTGRYTDAACWLKVGLWPRDLARPPFDIVMEARKYL